MALSYLNLFMNSIKQINDKMDQNCFLQLRNRLISMYRNFLIVKVWGKVLEFDMLKVYLGDAPYRILVYVL